MTVGYRGPNYPIGYLAGPTGTSGTATFIKRVQDFSVEEDAPQQPLYEMGNGESVGIYSGEKMFNGSISWYPIDMSLERAISGRTGGVTLTDFVGATGIRLVGRDAVLAGAVLESLQYNVSVGQPSEASAKLKGIDRTSLGSISLTATDPVSTEVIFRPEQIQVYVGVTGTGTGVGGWQTGTVARRAQRANISASVNREDAYEIGTANPIGSDGDTPAVNAQIDFIAGDATAGDVYIPASAPLDIEVRFGAAFKLRMYRMVTSKYGHRGSARGYATRQVSYVSAGGTANGGLLITTDMLQ